MTTEGDTHIASSNDAVRIFIHVHGGKLKMNFCKRNVGNSDDEWTKVGTPFNSKALQWDSIKSQVASWLSNFGGDFGNLLDAIGQEYRRFV